MSDQVGSGVDTSDDVLLEQTQTGDQRAFAELWRRHYRSGARVARQFTSLVDADDLVAEAFTRIYQRVMAGGTRISAFRPYLYTTIRNLASSAGAASREIPVDDLSDFEDPRTEGDPAMLALDRTLTARAFRALPERWQTVLWYTEVEGMDPHEVAPIMGIAPNSVAALSYRAREGLRKAWLQAHINDSTASGECRWVIARMGEHARKALTERETARVSGHLLHCTRCSIINAEVDEVGSRLALVLIPLLLGSAAGGTLLASLGNAGTTLAGDALSAVPAVPDTISSISDTVSNSHVTISTIAGASVAAPLAIGAATTTFTAPVLLAGSLAVVIAVSGTFVVASSQAGPGGGQSDADSSAQTAPPDPADPAGDSAGALPGAEPGTISSGSTPGPGEPTNIPVPGTSGSPGVVDSLVGGIGGVVGGVVDGVVDPLLGTITGGAPPEGHSAPGGVVGADISLNLSGSGTPGAKVSLQAAGQVYATTTVDSNGKFTLAATAIPGGLSSLELVQSVDKSFLRGLLGPVLGLVDSLVNGLVKPLNLVTQPVGITIVVMG